MAEQLPYRKVPFAPPRIDEVSIAEVVDTLKSGWITTGPKVAAFQEELEKYTGAEKVLCVNSATAGLELMLRWYGVGRGDEVILPAYTYCATANVVVRCGATPVMVDSVDDYNLNIEQVRSKINERTKVIIPVDIAGWPSPYQELMDMVIESDIQSQFEAKNEVQDELGRIMILGDAAHSIGATVNEKKVGALCDATVFSFHAVKNLTTAEGGAICFNFKELDNVELHASMRTLILHGQSKDARAKMEAGGWKYDVEVAGYKMNMSDLHASLGLVEIKRYDEQLTVRKQIHNRYVVAFEPKNWVELPTAQSDEAESSYHLFLLRIKGISEATRDHIMQDIAQAGIAVNVHFQPLPRLTVYREMGYLETDYPIAMDLYSRTISLPIYFDLSEADQQYVIQQVIGAVEKHTS